MKKLLLTALSLISTACANGNYDPTAGECVRSGIAILQDVTTDTEYIVCREKQVNMELQKQYEDKLKNDPAFAKAEELRVKQVEQEKRETEQSVADQKRDEEQLLKNKTRVMKFGSLINEFKKYHGEPTTEEIVNGATVLWYDDQSNPTYVVFKKDRLTSIFLDRDTLQQRQNAQLQNQQMQADERRHQENQESARKARVLSAIQNFQQSSPQQAQQPYMMPMIKQPVTTNCRNNGYGTVTCTSN